MKVFKKNYYYYYYYIFICSGVYFILNRANTVFLPEYIK